MTTSTTTQAFSVQIYIAGNAHDAARICRQFCFEVGMCVTCTPTEYIYTGGQESGVIIGLINYARFPREPADIVAVAEDLGHRLMEGLSQHSFSVVTPETSTFISRRPAP